MTDDTILDGVRDVLRSKLQIERTIDPATDLLRDLELDSIQLLTLVVELENRFRVSFAPGDEQGISTVAQLVQLVSSSLRPAQVSDAG